MCTVAFIPFNGKYFIASLRDEHPNRLKANMSELSILHQQKYIAPIDPQGGGTWVGINEAGAAIVLLNGGFENHPKKDHYAKSRGLIVTDLLATNLPIDHWNKIALQNIEPFTLILWTGISLLQLVWDGEKKYEMPFDVNHAHIWSSATLYHETEKTHRQNLFNAWMKHSIEKNHATLFDFFNASTETNASIFIRNSIAIKTHSYTFIEIIPKDKNTILYHDLSAEKITRFSLNN